MSRPHTPGVLDEQATTVAVIEPLRVPGLTILRAATAVLGTLSVLAPAPAAGATPIHVHPPGQDNAWPLLVFARLDSFSTRFDRFFHAQFDTVDTDRLPTWLEVDAGSLVFGEQVLARTVPVDGNEEAILAKFQDLVSMSDEIGMTQFGAQPTFPEEYFVLGHEDGELTLVAYDNWDPHEPVKGPDIVRALEARGAFVTGDPKANDLVVLCRGNLMEVHLWYPSLAKQVLHTHTIPGNINPTGYLEFFEGSDRDMILVGRRFQDPVKRYVLGQEDDR